MGTKKCCSASQIIYRGYVCSKKKNLAYIFTEVGFGVSCHVNINKYYHK